MGLGMSEPNNAVTVVRVPVRWADDAIGRDLNIGREVRRSSSHVWLEQTPGQHKEGLSDASFYASEWVHMGREFVGLGSSARHAAAALRRALPSEGVTVPKGPNRPETALEGRIGGP